MTSKGQITVPKPIREALGIGPGDEIEFEKGNGGFVLRKRVGRSLFTRYRGLLKPRRHKKDVDAVLQELRGACLRR